MLPNLPAPRGQGRLHLASRSVGFLAIVSPWRLGTGCHDRMLASKREAMQLCTHNLDVYLSLASLYTRKSCGIARSRTKGFMRSSRQSLLLVLRPDRLVVLPLALHCDSLLKRHRLLGR